MKAFHLPQNPELVVTSDVHIRTEHDERYLLLCQLVEEAIRVRARGLVLNGDIFDFFFGWGSYFRGKYSRLLGALDALANNGAGVWFVVGNHEFGLEKLERHHKFKIVPSEGRVWSLDTGRRILIAHGDLMRSDPGYRIFRSIVRSSLANLIAVSIPQRWLDRFTLWFASTSRKKDRYRVLNHERIIESASDNLRRADADTVIFGHFHHPYDETKADKSRILSVSSWDSPSCLVMDRDGVFSRIVPADGRE